MFIRTRNVVFHLSHSCLSQPCAKLVPSVKDPHIWPVRTVSPASTLASCCHFFFSVLIAARIFLWSRSLVTLWCTQTRGSFPSHSVNTESLGHCSLYRYCEVETQCEKHWKITQIVLKYLAKEIKLLKLIVAIYFILACKSEVFLLLKWFTLFLAPFALSHSTIQL